MRHRIDNVSDSKNARIIHFNRRIADKTTFFNNAFECETFMDVPAFMRIIFTIPGVEQVVLEQYRVRVHKAELFNWEDILPYVVLAIQGEIEPDGKITECGPSDIKEDRAMLHKVTDVP